MSDFFSVREKNAVVTGGTAGIGLATAKRLAAAGARVIISGRRDGDEIAAKINATFIRADISRKGNVASLFEKAEAQLGPLDIVVNNAAIDNAGPMIEDASYDELDRVFATNLTGVFGCLKECIGRMRDGGAIVNIGSIGGVIGAPGFSQYSATKAAVISLSQTAAVELAPRSIRVNAVSPGAIKTDMVPDDHQDVKLVRMLCPLARLGAPEDIAALIHYLASDDAKYITGQNIIIDGGWTTGYSKHLADLIMMN